MRLFPSVSRRRWGHRLLVLATGSVVLGIVFACGIELARMARPVDIYVDAPRAAATASERAVIVDVARGVTDVLPLLGIAPGEHVVAIDDRPITDEDHALALLRVWHVSAQRYTDITTTRRRILVLHH